MPHGQRLHERCCGHFARRPFALSGTERKYERSRPFRIHHLELTLTLLMKEASVEGTATLSFERVDESAEALELDAIGFDIRSVELLGKKKKRGRPNYTYDGDTVSIIVPESQAEGRVRIRYRAKPARGLYFLSPDEKVPDRPVQVWSQCQDEDARYWFPCHDKPHAKMTLDLTAKVPAGFVVLSNGDPVGANKQKGKDKLWTYRFRMADPVPSYLVSLVAGRFDVVEDRFARVGGKGSTEVPVQYLVPQGRSADAKRSFGDTPDMIELFSKLTGVPFPWSRYSQVVVSDFIFGGMENTTATTLYEHVMLDERASLDITSADLIAHELAHHWFGDFVTCRDWSHAWLNEGFATFFEHLERESRLGRDEYEYGVAGDCQTYLSEAGWRYQRPIVCRDYDAPIDLFDRHLYEKGGLCLHMLRRRLGDDVFWRGVRAYLEDHAHGIVETNDLQRALENASGKSLDGFFDQWVYRPGHPVLDVRVSYEDSQVVVTVKQKQRGNDVAVFDLPVEVVIKPKKGPPFIRKKRIGSREDALVAHTAERPEWVGFDPDYRITADIKFRAPADMLEKQLKGGSTARLRWTAAEALSERDDPSALKALTSVLGKKREAWMVRAECARALGRMGGDDAFNALESRVTDPHHKVRRAVVSALGEFRTPEAARLLSRSTKKDASYLVEAESCRSLGKTKNERALALLLDVVDQPSWADVKRAGALDGLAALRSDDAIEPVIDRTRYGVPARGRRAAISALARIGEGRRVRQHLEDLLDDRDPHLRISVVNALSTLGDTKARSALRRAASRERDGRVARRIREVLASLGDGGAADQRALKEEVEQLRKAVDDLKLRLGKVESKKKSPGRRKAKRS